MNEDKTIEVVLGELEEMLKSLSSAARTYENALKELSAEGNVTASVALKSAEPSLVEVQSRMENIKKLTLPYA